MRYALIACLGIAAAACSRNVEVVSTPGGSASVVTSREWTLVALGNSAVPAAGRPVTLRFDAGENRASGLAPCNQYSGPYTMTRDSLRFGAIISTKMACTDDSRNLLEQKYLGGLSAVTTYQQADSTLTLLSTAGEIARFRSR